MSQAIVQLLGDHDKVQKRGPRRGNKTLPRSSSTNDKERIFWEAVRSRRFLGKKFSRQYPIFHEGSGSYKFYIVDFYCHEHRIAVELDGSSHDGREEDDRERSEIIETDGVRVLRFRNEEVEEDIAEVLQQLKRFING